LRIISGLDKEKLTSPYFEELQNKQGSAAPNTPNQYEDLMKRDFYTQLGTDAPKDNEEYKKIRSDFERMILHSFGVKDKYEIAKVLSPLASRSLDLADDFSLFEFTYKNLNKSVHSIESSVNELDEYLLDQDSILKSTPLTLPVNGWITSYYGPRVNPVSGNLQMHEGLDVGAPNGAPIHSAADGIVIFSGTKPGFGQHVQIDHGYGIETIYAHSSRVLVKKGDKIVRGDLIAQVGSTGHSTGPHLHYEVRVNGVAVDPYYFLLDQ
jgi:murein DD-endopeptidase MepM/ murein hydrolase activator NlpD